MQEAQSDAVRPDDATGAGRWSGGEALALVGAMFACEAGAALLFVIAGQALLAMLATVVGVAIALRWVRWHRRQAVAAISSQTAAAREALAAGSRTTAWNLACAAAEAAPDRPPRNAALAVMIDVAVEEGDLRTARALLARLGPPREVDPLLEAAIETADGSPDRAIAALERGRWRPTFGERAARRLIELWAERDELSRAVEVALECLHLLAEQDVRNMIASLEDWGAPDQATTLAAALALRAPTATSGLALRRAADPLRD